MPETGDVGWRDTFVFKLGHLLETIASGGDVGPVGATFENGFRASLVCDAILGAPQSGVRDAIGFRLAAPVGDTSTMAAVTLVVTEHASCLDVPRRDGYERMRRRLEEIRGSEVRAVHYVDVNTFTDAGAVVISGSSAPWAAHAPNAFGLLREAVDAYDGPVLGICAGMQLLATFAGGTVGPLANRCVEAERGFLPLEVLDASDLMRGLPARPTVFQDHLEEITELPEGFRVLAQTDACRVQAIAATERRWWGTQFHPERSDAARPDGDRVLRNFFALAE